jgi:hypothetical protein
MSYQPVSPNKIFTTSFSSRDAETLVVIIKGSLLLF